MINRVASPINRIQKSFNFAIGKTTQSDLTFQKIKFFQKKFNMYMKIFNFKFLKFTVQFFSSINNIEVTSVTVKV